MRISEAFIPCSCKWFIFLLNKHNHPGVQSRALLSLIMFQGFCILAPLTTSPGCSQSKFILTSWRFRIKSPVKLKKKILPHSLTAPPTCCTYHRLGPNQRERESSVLFLKSFFFEANLSNNCHSHKWCSYIILPYKNHHHLNESEPLSNSTTTRCSKVAEQELLVIDIVKKSKRHIV